MCGIAGIFQFGADARPMNGKMTSMLECMRHRGPDGERQWWTEDHRITLGHNRLAIIDLSEAAYQPMHSPDGRYTIIFNGEIYNYLELRTELEKEGERFVTSSDTEVLLRSFMRTKERALQKLDGMFAFAIWDAKEQKLFMARDRFGEKPLFFFRSGAQLLFASEVKALIAAGVKTSVDRSRLALFLSEGIADDPDDASSTFFSEIREVPAASYVHVGVNGNFDPVRYWHPVQKEKFRGDIEDASHEFLRLLDCSVNRRLRSDVPVGTSLSGGLDSSSIALLISFHKEKTQRQAAFSARFRNFEKDEGAFIQEVASLVHAELHETWPGEPELFQKIEELFYFQEQPFISTSIFAQWKVMQIAREHGVKVMLDGQGADELYAGYHHFFNPFLLECSLRSSALYRRERSAIIDRHGGDFGVPALLRWQTRFRKTHSVARKPRTDHPQLTGEFIKGTHVLSNVFHTSLNGALEYAALHTGLPQLLRYADRNAMAHSVEVRLPFLSYELAEFAFSLPAEMKIHKGWTKFVQRKAMDGKLPSSVTWRKEKIGYVTPQQNWLSGSQWKELHSRSTTELTERDVLKPGSTMDAWRTIMAAMLYRFIEGVGWKKF